MSVWWLLPLSTIALAAVALILTARWVAGAVGELAEETDRLSRLGRDLRRLQWEVEAARESLARRRHR